jgi:hypothetical protein
MSQLLATMKTPMQLVTNEVNSFHVENNRNWKLPATVYVSSSVCGAHTHARAHTTMRWYFLIRGSNKMLLHNYICLRFHHVFSVALNQWDLIKNSKTNSSLELGSCVRRFLDEVADELLLSKWIWGREKPWKPADIPPAVTEILVKSYILFHLF